MNKLILPAFIAMQVLVFAIIIVHIMTLAKRGEWIKVKESDHVVIDRRLDALEKEIQELKAVKQKCNLTLNQE